MNCDICGRHYHAQRLPFLCPVDARNRLYEPRLAHAVALLQNEKLEQQVNAELLPLDGADGQETSSSRTGSRTGVTANYRRGTSATPSARSRVDAWEGERQDIVDRTSDIAARAEQLRRDMESARKELERRKDVLRQRRSDLAAASNGTAARRTRMQADVERSISMTKFKWNQSYEAMAATRGFLCMEASKLYGLRRLKKGSAVRYEIGGFEIVDPYNMNNLPPEVVSTSLAHVTHILMLACHYLSIRLPAEVTLPHRDYPRPTIFSLSSSYSHGDVPFPGTANLQPALAPNSRDRDPFQRVPRPRPLYIDKALPLLAKEDGSTHTMFLEGIALLAYDVAWACCSQGVPIGEKSSFDDVFSIGRNLYNLLIGNQLLNNPAGRIFSASSATSLLSGSPSRAAAGGGGGGGGPGGEAASELGKATTAMMGRYSHGTAHTFLGDDIVQAFKLPSPNRLADRLKTRLSSESTMPDWEVLEDDAWAVDEDDQGNLEDGVLPRAAKHSDGGSSGRRGSGTVGNGGSGDATPQKRLFGVESMATVITSLEDAIAEADLEGQRPNGRNPDKPRAAGTSGWTKLRNRQ